MSLARGEAGPEDCSQQTEDADQIQTRCTFKYNIQIRSQHTNTTNTNANTKQMQYIPMQSEAMSVQNIAATFAQVDNICSIQPLNCPNNSGMYQFAKYLLSLLQEPFCQSKARPARLSAVQSVFVFVSAVFIF